MSVGTQPQGVMIPQSQLATADEGTPFTVKYAFLMHPVQVLWFDENGVGHAELWFIGADNVVYQPPNSEAWASQLTQVKDSLANGVMQRVGDQLRAKSSQSMPLPKDSVDVLGGADGGSPAA